MTNPFDGFETSKGGSPTWVALRVRDDLAAGEQRALTAALEVVPWARLHGAYGPAVEVPVHLYAATVGQAEARAAAWWELWGNVHHQGTVYEATVPAVPFIAAIAGNPEHPDRVQAVSFVRELAVGSGQHGRTVREAVRPLADSLLSRAEDEPLLVRQALVWLLSAFPSWVPAHPGLVRLVPEALRQGWSDVLDRVRTRHEDQVDDEASFDRQDAFERWALAGWVG